MSFPGRRTSPAATERFSSRVEDYIKYRPSYPPELLAELAHTCGLISDSVVSDIGSGTGILTELLLKTGCRVFGVEPNREMREAGERRLAGYPGFVSIAGTAEATSLPDKSVDLVTAGQAFHWFQPVPARAEFKRALKPGGWVALLWNERRTITPFLAAYEQVLQTYGTDYKEVDHRRVDDAAVRSFFAEGSVRRSVFENRQAFDFEGLKGRTMSASYVPAAGQPGHAALIEALRGVYDAHQEAGAVTFEYDARLYCGRFEA